MTDYSLIPDCFYRVSIKALILDDEGRFLLCREDDGRWEFPWGGYDHADTSPAECIRRELMEEMWVRALKIEENPYLFVKATHAKKWFQFANLFYKTEIENLDFTPSDECQEVQFFTIEEALKLELFPNVIEFCKYYKA